MRSEFHVVTEDVSIAAPSGWCIEFFGETGCMRVLNPSKHVCYAEHMPWLTYGELWELATSLEPRAIIALVPAEPI